MREKRQTTCCPKKKCKKIPGENLVRLGVHGFRGTRTSKKLEKKREGRSGLTTSTSCGVSQRRVEGVLEKKENAPGRGPDSFK